MMRIIIICLGKLKEKYWREAEVEYIKRLLPYAKIEIKELKEEPFTEKNKPVEIKKKEAKKIMAALPKTDGFIVALDEHGKQYSSVSLAQELHNSKNTSPLIIIIGGPLGLDDSILKLADLKLSLSPLTFTHQMVRVILLEQIYRATMINVGKKYHY